MPNFEYTEADLPTTDKDGNPITETNPLTLEDILAYGIESTDPVLGLRAGRSLDLSDPEASIQEAPYTWALLGPFLRDIFLNKRIDDVFEALANQNITIEEASETVKGIIAIANINEANAFSDLKKAITPYLLGQVLQNGSGVATTTRKGTSARATDTESINANNTEKHVPPSGLRAFIRGTIAAATTTYRGAVEKLTQTEARAMNDNERYLTTALLKDIAQNSSTFRNIIRGLVPVNRYRSGRGLTSVRINGTNYQAVSDTVSGTAITVPNGESFMGGKGYEVLMNEGFALSVISNTIVATGTTTLNHQSIWEFWTREN